MAAMTIENLLPKSTFSVDDDIRTYGLDRHFSDHGISFVALDLETASSSRNSICEIGITIVENGEVVNSISWLIKPPGNRYDSLNIYIHGIKPKDTESCPTLSEIWPEVLSYIDGKIVVAHNTSFDMYVLRDSFLENNIPFPSFAHFCSCRLSRKVISCYSYSLPYVCEDLGIEFDQHHRASSDSEACAKVFIECLKLSGVDSFSELEEKFDFRCGRFSDNYFRPQLSNNTGKGGKYIVVKDIQGDPSKIDEGSYFYQKEVCFTGKCEFANRQDLLQMIADIGGIPANTVTSRTDILVVGQQDYRVVGEDGMSSKQKKAMALRDKGQDIEIMSEAEAIPLLAQSLPPSQSPYASLGDDFMDRLEDTCKKFLSQVINTEIDKHKRHGSTNKQVIKEEISKVMGAVFSSMMEDERVKNACTAYHVNRLEFSGRILYTKTKDMEKMVDLEF